jgi:glycosyltransferase involved in cell wall biosynthesis
MDINKKIALLCNYELLPERVGGMDYFFWEFDKKCKQNNIEIDWFFPNKSNHGEYLKLTVIESNYQNVEVYFLNFCKKNKQNYTHIITHFVELCTPFFYKIKQIESATIIVVDHNPRPIAGYSIKKRIEKKSKGFLFSKYIDVFVGVSNYTVKEIVNDFGRHLKKKTLTIYNGVIIKDIKARKVRNMYNLTFLVASHLRESKGIQDLIEAVSKLSLEIKNRLKIDVYGDGPFKNNLLEKVTLTQTDNIFKFLGSQSNLNEIYFQYDYMLHPTHMECFSLSILESLAANVPVITTNVGGNEEVIQNDENGFIFEAKNIDQLRKLIEKLMNVDIGIKMNTRILIENEFSLDLMVNNHFKLLQQ